jgi:uncharacterized iron-regulated membrane protein
LSLVVEDMKSNTRQALNQLHTWVGITAAWLLFFMFVTGSTGFFDTEIDRWMKPELPQAKYDVNESRLINASQAYLTQHASNANRWLIYFPIDRNDPYPRLLWRLKNPDGNTIKQNALFNIETGKPFQTRQTGGGQQLYQMHWRFHYMPRHIAEIMAGVAAMAMLLALITGVLIHKPIFKEFFTFRPNRKRRTWLDLHTMVAVSSLPFQLMMTVTGLVFLMFSLVPTIVDIFYGFDADHAFIKAQQKAIPSMTKPAKQTAELAPLATILQKAQQQWPQQKIRRFDIYYPQDVNSRVVVETSIAASPLRSANRLIFDGVTGKLLAQQQARQSDIQIIHDTLLGLHEATFASISLRWLYFISGLLGAMMIATGLILWVKKRQSSASSSVVLINKLNTAVLVGLPTSIAAYFIANRILATSLADRAEWEANCMFFVWLVMFIHAYFRNPKSALFEQCMLASLLYFSIPLIGIVTQQNSVLMTVTERNWSVAGIDVFFFATAITFAFTATKIRRNNIAVS